MVVAGGDPRLQSLYDRDIEFDEQRFGSAARALGADPPSEPSTSFSFCTAGGLSVRRSRRPGTDGYFASGPAGSTQISAEARASS